MPQHLSFSLCRWRSTLYPGDVPCFSFIIEKHIIKRTHIVRGKPHLLLQLICPQPIFRRESWAWLSEHLSILHFPDKLLLSILGTSKSFQSLLRPGWHLAEVGSLLCKKSNQSFRRVHRYKSSHRKRWICKFSQQKQSICKFLWQKCCLFATKHCIKPFVEISTKAWSLSLKSLQKHEAFR